MMKKGRAKVTALLLALGCCAACVGAGVAISTPPQTAISVSAEECTIHDLGKLAVHANSNGSNTNTPKATQLYMKIASGMAIPYPDGTWETEFALESGAGWKLNGESITVKDIESTNNGLYVPLEGVEVGDIVSVEGTFYSADVNAKYVIAESKFKWNGTAWETVEVEQPGPDTPAECTVHELGLLAVHKNSDGTGTNTPKATQLYMKIASGKAIPYPDGTWNTEFAYESGAGWKLNGESITVADIESTNNGLFVNLANAGVQVGDIVSVEGTFYSADVNAKYVIKESKFKWNGTAWEDCSSYTTYEMGGLKFKDWTAGRNHIYLQRMDGKSTPKPEDGNNGWTATFAYKNGVGVTLNGKAVSSKEIKFPWGEMFINLNASVQGAPEEGDELVIGGTFYNADLETQYVVEETAFKWNGTTWILQGVEKPEVELPEANYEIYELGELSVNWASDGNSSTAVPKSTQLYMKSSLVSNLPYQSWEHEFAYASGAGWTLNGQDVTVMVSDIESTDAGLFVDLSGAGVKAGDILSVEGTFYCYKQGSVAAKYVIAESKFVWTGAAWEKYVVYTEYAIEALDVLANQTANNAVSLKKADGTGFASSNPYKFLPGSGAGITLNGIALNTGKINVSAEELLIELGTKANDGDVLAIHGTFYNVADGVKYVIEENRFLYASGSWSVYTSDYSEVGLGEMDVVADVSTARVLYFTPSDASVDLPVESDDEDVFVRAYGTGVTLNGVEVAASMLSSSLDNTLYLALPQAANVNDVLMIGGKFVCESQNTLYFVQESVFVWNGESWTKRINYTTYTVGLLALYGNSANQNAGDASILQLKAKSHTFAKEEFTLTLESGIGLTINGKQTAWTSFQNHKDGYLHMTFDAVQVGDVVKIGGTFVCPEKAVKYVVYESTFVWDGYWSVHCEEVYVGAVDYHGTEPNMENALHIAPLSGQGLPVNDWTPPFLPVGDGFITLNGVQIDYSNHVKSLGKTIFIALPKVPEEGDLLIINGKFRCAQHYVEYVFEESILLYKNGVWENQLFLEQATKASALSAYIENFREADYYATEWSAMQQIVNEGRAKMETCVTRAEVQAVYDAAIAEMNDVATKTEVDAYFNQWVTEAKAEVEAYKDASLYREAEQAQIAQLVAKAKTDIDAAQSSTALKKIVKDTKAALDALFTDEQWTAAETYAEAAKEELFSYKSSADYKDAEWFAIQKILISAFEKIDAGMATKAVVDKAVADAKASMDAVKTAVQVNAEQAEIAAAKLQLTNYKKESDYNAPEWAEIQRIIAKASADIDAAVGESDAIASIVEAAKLKIDKVLTGAQADAKAFEDAKWAAEEAIRDFVDEIDYAAYTDENAAIVNGYVVAAVEQLANATTYADLEGLVDTLKAQVNSVEKMEKASGGCGSMIGLTAGVALMATAALVLRKKKED